MTLEPHRRFLDETVIPMRLACQTRSKWPFVLSLWYLYRDNSLYCATQASARIVEYVHNDPRCAFEIASDLPPYCGIRGQAKAEIIPELGGEILEELLIRYLGGTSNLLARNLLKKGAAEVAICLRPVSVYTWNFTDRMKDSLTGFTEKPCPDINAPQS